MRVLLLVPLLALAACAGGTEAPVPAANGIATLSITASSTSMLIGQTLRLTLVARGLTGAEVPVTGTPAWSSSNPAVVAVDADGRVTGMAAGNATISATVSGVTGSLAFTVSPTVTAAADVFTPGNKFSPSLVTVAVGGTVRFNITGVPHNVVFEKKAGAPADINVVDNVVVSRAFPVAGSFPFDCTVHPGMSGQVIVR